jgi:hypothetical protein
LARYTGSKQGRAPGGPNVPVLLGSGVAILMLFGGGYLWLKNAALSAETDIATGCLLRRQTPEAMLVLVDETDKLTKENAERIRTHVVDRVNELPRYSRVIIVPFGGDLAKPLQPVFDKCVPGRGDQAGPTEGSLILKKQYEEFSRTFDGLVDKLQEIPDSKTSPIAEQVVRAASDEVLHWDGQSRSLYLVTDGLESSIYWTKELRLNKPSGDILRGVKVEYFEVGNEKASRYQTAALREQWKNWLAGAGAEVRMNAPGYAASGATPPG